MVQLNSLTILDGLLRSQCVQGTFCLDKKYNKNTLLKQNIQHGTPGTIITLQGKLLRWCRTPSVLESLGGIMIDTSHLFIKGYSTLDALEYNLGLMLLIQNFYPKFFRVFTLEEQLECFRYLKLVPKKYVIKVQKYMTAEAPNMYLEQSEHNAKPDYFDRYLPNVLGFTGRCKRFLMNRLVRKSGTNRFFWNSYLQGIKRCCHEAEDEVLYDEYLKHRDTLTEPPKGELSDRVKTYILRVTEGIRLRKVRLFEASTSASFSTPRSQGGQRADVRKWLVNKYGYSTKDSFVDNNTYYRLDAPNIPNDTDKLAKDICNDFIYKKSPRSKTSDCFTRRPLKVKVHGILEPLKVRKITKGEAVPYWYCRSVQKDLHGSLQRFPQFAPTGRPIERYDIHELINREHSIESKCPLGFDGWVSGDYSAATDGVDIRVTMKILEEILDQSRYSEYAKDICRAVLGPQMLHYPKIRGKDPIDPALQRTGQLMGSILSFPVLCYINIITYWMTLEEYTGHVYELGELPCIVNGDDILFRANEEFYNLWKTNIKSVGFTMSIGKNYFHKDTFLINSQMYHIAGNVTSGHYTLDLVPMYNLGLLTGKAKTTGRDWCKVTPIWSWYKEVVGNAYDKWDAHKKFLHFHDYSIYKLTNGGQRNLFIPRWLGGCGFPLYPEVEEHIRVTAYQQTCASYVRYKVEHACKHGEHPGKYVLRLMEEDLSSSDSSHYHKDLKTRAYTTITLPCYDKYKLIPRTQPLNYNETLELQRQYNLPLLANIPDNFDKRDLVVNYPKYVNYRKAARLLSEGGFKPLPKDSCLHGPDWKLVRVRNDTLQEILARNEEGNLDDEILPDYDEFIVEHDKYHTGVLSNDLKIITEDHTIRTLRKVEERKLPGGHGISLVIHQEI
jgi:hypothetical protein